MVEIWKDIPGYPKYEVSSQGRVRRSNKEPLLGDVVKGYRRYALHIAGKQFRKTAHQLVCLAFYGPPTEERWQINHKDGDRSNNNLANLEYCTNSENQLHRYRVLGKYCNRGEAHGMSILTESIVKEIRELRPCMPTGKIFRARYPDPRSIQAISEKYGISRQAISFISNRKLWRHI